MEKLSIVSNNYTYSRIAISYTFFVFGIISANWLIRIPEFQKKFSLTGFTLGLVLTGVAIGSLSTLTLIGRIIARFGSKKVITFGIVLYHCIFPLLPLMPSAFTLFLCLIVFGSSATTLNIAMNTQGVELEQRLNYSVMSSFHAAFSIGGFIGAFIGAIIIRIIISPEIHFLLVTLFLFPFTLFFMRFYLYEKRSATLQKTIKRHSFLKRLPGKDTLILGTVVFIAVLGEFMTRDWSTIYLSTVIKTGSDVAALGFAFFSLTMTFGRISGDKIMKIYRPDKIIRICGFLASLGLLIVALLQDFLLVLVGFALLGIGLSVLVPLTFKTAGNKSKSNIGTGIANIAIFSYLAGLIEPTFIGSLSDIFSLQIAFIIVSFLFATLIITGKSLKSESQKS
ncbi:MAG: MFS transporter [Candidatus Thorarchaeota archaeon]